MSGDPHLEKLRDAIQDYARAHATDELILTDFALAYAGVNMRTADTQTYLSHTASGPVHATLGLAHALVHDLTTDLEGDAA